MTTDDPENAAQSFFSHLVELRTRLLRTVIAIAVLLVALLPFSRNIYAWLAGPLLAQLPEGSAMIAVEVASPLLTPFKMTFMVALFLAAPLLLHQAWAFVAPGLYGHEKRIARPILVSSILLFYAGCAFAYYVVFPLVFAFFAAAAPEGVLFMPDISHYLDFLLLLFFAFGFAFEVPIAVFILVATGLTSPETLRKKRPYVIVAAFTIGMLLTPPDVISQVLLAGPMWALYELGIVFSQFLLRKKQVRKESA